MGPALTNLDGLLEMPYGCGEQNMAKFAPNIYIMDYLTNTNQITKKIQDNAKHYMNTGGYTLFQIVRIEKSMVLRKKNPYIMLEKIKYLRVLHYYMFVRVKLCACLTCNYVFKQTT